MILLPFWRGVNITERKHERKKKDGELNGSDINQEVGARLFFCLFFNKP